MCISDERSLLLFLVHSAHPQLEKDKRPCGFEQMVQHIKTFDLVLLRKRENLRESDVKWAWTSFPTVETSRFERMPFHLYEFGFLCFCQCVYVCCSPLPIYHAGRAGIFKDNEPICSSYSSTIKQRSVKWSQHVLCYLWMFNRCGNAWVNRKQRHLHVSSYLWVLVKKWESLNPKEKTQSQFQMRHEESFHTHWSKCAVIHWVYWAVHF